MAARSQDRVIALYEAHGALWAEKRDKSLFERGWLDRFCALLPERGSILDAGCGTGDPIARSLLRAGFQVTGVDASPGMIAQFRAQAPNAEAVVGDLRTLALGAQFHGLLAWHSLFHLAPEDQRTALATLAAHAAPRAALMFTAGPQAGESEGRLAGEALYHASLSDGEYRAILRGHGFICVAQRMHDADCRGASVWLFQRDG
jgi:SAM-dependent methyltransferase